MSTRRPPPLETTRSNSETELASRIYSRSRHFFSSVLNDPRSSASTALATALTSSKSQDPNLSDPSLSPAASIAHFKPYLAAVTPDWIAFQEQQQQQQQTSSASSAKGTSSSTTSTSSLPSPSPARNTVPELFFQEGFSMSNLNTYSAVLESLPSESPDDPIALATLAKWSSLVEAELASAIAQQSDGFFSALSDLQGLHDTVASAVAAIHALRTYMRRSDSTLAVKALDLQVALRRRARVVSIARLVASASSVATTQSRVQGALASSDYVGALDAIAAAQSALAGDLGGLTAFRHMPHQLTELQSMIGKMMTVEFSKIALGELAPGEPPLKHSFQVPLDPLPWSPPAEGEHLDIAGALSAFGVDPDAAELGEAAASSLGPLVIGFSRLNTLNTAIDTWRDDLTLQLKEALRAMLTEALGGAEEDAAALEDRLARLSRMSSDLFASFMRAMYRLVLTTLRRANNLIALIESSSPSSSAQEVAWSTCELMHRQCGTYLSIRAEQHARLRLPAWTALHDDAAAFMLASEALVGDRRCSGLRGCLAQQSKAWLSSFHSTQLDKLVMMLDAETWKSAPVAPEFQGLVDAIEGSSSASGSTANAKVLKIAGSPWGVANSVLMTLQILSEYLDVAKAMPPVRMELVGRVAELLRRWNSRSSQLVLGAGAMHVAGLKSISARHLAVTSQCVGALAAFVPALAKAFGELLPEQGRAALLPELTETIAKDLKEHRKELFTKLVSIMEDRLQAHVSGLASTTLSSTKLPTPTPYMTDLLKETATLNKVLASALPPPEVNEIFTEVLAVFEAGLKEGLTAADKSSAAAKKRLKEDVAAFYTGWSNLTSVPEPSTPRVLETALE